MRVLPIALVLASCDATSGLIINVVPTDKVSDVRIYLATAAPTTLGGPMPGMVPPGASSELSGAYWPRSVFNDQDHVSVAANETARFVYTGSGTVTAIIAVGYDHGTPVSAASRIVDTPIPNNHFDSYELDLAPATPIGKSSPLQLVAWSPAATTPADQATCVGVSTGTTWAFIVDDPDDPDCDGIKDAECPGDDLVYFGEVPLDRTQRDAMTCVATRVVTTTGGPATSRCMLGGPPCVDGGGGDPAACVAAAYCAPTSLCTCTDLTCASAKQTDPRIDCQIPAIVNAVNGDDLCDVGTVDLPISQLAPLAAKCANAALYDPSTSRFASSITTSAGITLELDDGGGGGCAPTIKLTGQNLTAAELTGSALAIFDIDSPDGSGIVVADNGLAIPINFTATPVSQCDVAAPPHCVITSAPLAETANLKACAGAPAR